MKLLTENKRKVMNNYLFNLKFSGSKTGLRMLCHVALICTIYSITDMICTVEFQVIDLVRFLALLYLCLFLSYVNQTTKTKKKTKKQIRGTELPKQKTNFLLPRFLFFFVNSKTSCTYTVWNVSKYGIFLGSYFPAFRLLNTDRYFVSLRIHSKCEKIRTRKISIFGHFSCSFTLTVRCQVAAKGQKHLNKPLAKRCYLFQVYITFCYNQAWDC